MKKTILGFSLLLSFLACNTIQAQDKTAKQGKRNAPPEASELLIEMDANEDGKLSESEVKGPLQKHFSEIDIDKDGFLSKAELEKMPPPPKKGKGRKEQN